MLKPIRRCHSIGVNHFLQPIRPALAGFGDREIRSNGRRLTEPLAILRWCFEWAGPQLLSATVFLAGSILLLSGATPGIDRRMAFLAHAIPEPLLEFSHLTGSMIGLGLLVLARGLYRRVDAAWWMTLLLMAGGVLAEMLKGIDYEEAILLALIMLALWVSRRRFTCRAALFERRFSTMWFVGVALVLGSAVWLGLAVYRDVPYANELWWTFAFESGAPRWLRASLVTGLMAGGLSLWQLAGRGARMAAAEPTAEDLVRAAACVATSRDTIANVALLGDKQLLFSPPGDAFIMFQPSGRSFVALGDPVGNPESRAGLVWRFRELCDQNDALPVFYEVSDDRLPLYLDLGLSLTKLGEEARVPLSEFLLEGRRRGEFRTAIRKGGREGLKFAVVSPEELPPLIPELRQVSDQWLAAKATAEKGFSVWLLRSRLPRPFFLCDRAAARRDRGVRQSLAKRRPDRAEGGSDALRLPGAEGRHGLPVHRGDSIFNTPGSKVTSGSTSAWRRSPGSSAIRWRRSGTSLACSCIAMESRSTTSRACEGTKRSSIRSGGRAIWLRRAACPCRGCCWTSHR